MKKKLSLMLLLIGSINHCFAGDDYFMPRYNYYTAGNNNFLEFKYLHIYDNSAGLLLTAYNDLGHHVDQIKSTGNEGEFWYPLYVNNENTFRLMGGAQLTVLTAGSFVCANLGVFYNLQDDLSVGTRYRYVKFNYKTVDLNGNQAYSDFHQLDYYINYTFNQKWAMEFNATNNIYVNDFHRATGRKDNWEIKNTIKYHLNDTWTLQPQVGWYERDISQHRENFLLSMAVVYKF